MKNKLIYILIGIFAIGLVVAGVSISNQITLDKELVAILKEKGMDNPIVTNIKDYGGERHFDIKGGRTNLKVDKSKCIEYEIIIIDEFYNETGDCIDWYYFTEAELNASIVQAIKDDLEWTAQKLIERQNRLDSVVEIDGEMEIGIIGSVKIGI